MQCRQCVRQVQAQLLLIYQQFHTSVSNKLVTRAWSIAVVYCFCRVLLGRCSSTDRSTLLSLHDTMRRHKQTCQAIKSGAVDMRADGNKDLKALVPRPGCGTVHGGRRGDRARPRRHRRCFEDDAPCTQNPQQANKVVILQLNLRPENPHASTSSPSQAARPCFSKWPLRRLICCTRGTAVAVAVPSSHPWRHDGSANSHSA